MTVRQDQFQAIMPFLVDDLTALIVQRQSMSEEEAVMLLYRSTLYRRLEQEDTKLWQYSTEMLYSLFRQEQETGTISFPDV